MSARIRGHYRIDVMGRVEPITDVNALAKPFTLPLSVMQGKKPGKRSHVVQVSIAGMILFGMGVSLMAALPQIQRMVIAAEASRISSQRQAYIHSHPQLEALLAKRR